MISQLLEMMRTLSVIQQVIIYVLPLLLAITVHEAAHGYAAKYFGDMTAYKMGRISLNPLRHIDPVGTLLIPSMTLLLGGVFFGWAKPVPVNFGRLRNPKKDMLWVAAAGPGVNLLMAVMWAIVIKFSVVLPDAFAMPAAFMGAAGVNCNVGLMILNMLPLLPLDGGRVLVSLLPQRLAWQFSKIEPYGFIILIMLLFTGILAKTLWPLVLIVREFIPSVIL